MRKKVTQPFGQNVISCSNPFELEVSNCGIEPDYTRECNLGDFTVISTRGIVEGLGFFGVNQRFGVSEKLSV